MGGRGTAPVLGLVLLIGFVVAGALAVLAVGSTVVDQSGGDVERSQAEQSTVALAETADELADGDRERGTWSYDGAGDGSPRVEENTGRINVTQYVEGDPETVVVDDATMGAVTYTHDGTTYAYQAGAVWRLDDQGEPRLLRAPDLHYRGRTLTFPFVNVTGDVTAGAQAGSMQVTDTRSVYPDAPTHYNPLRNGTVVVEIESRFCQGWETYFRQRTDGALIEGCTETDDTVDDELKVELVVPFKYKGTDDSIRTESYTESGGGSSADVEDEEVVSSLDVPPADSLIERKRDACDGSFNDTLDDPETDPGLHCLDELDEDATFDTGTSDPTDIEVFLDGDLEYDGGEELEINGNGTVTLFIDGDVQLAGQSDLNCGYDTSAKECTTTPSQLRIFVASGNGINGTGSGSPSRLGAIVYGPGADADLQGALHFEGGLIAESVDVGSASIDIGSHDSVADATLEYRFGGRSIYYLHVTETEVTFEG